MSIMDIVIIDDSDEMLLVLSKILRGIPIVNLVGQATNGNDGISLVVEKRPHIVFLDIDMPGKNGLQVAKLIHEIDESMFIIFATGHDKYALESFDTHPFDYILKPYDPERIMLTLNSISTKIDSIPRDTKLTVKTDKGILFLKCSGIIMITKEERETRIYTQEGNIKTKDTLETIGRYLPINIFFRCHKSFIVNVHMVKEIITSGIRSYTLIMEGIDEIALMPRKNLSKLENMIKKK